MTAPAREPAERDLTPGERELRRHARGLEGKEELTENEQRTLRRYDTALSVYCHGGSWVIGSWPRDMPEWLDPRTLDWVADRIAEHARDVGVVYDARLQSPLGPVARQNRDFPAIMLAALWWPLLYRLRIRSERLRRRDAR